MRTGWPARAIKTRFIEEWDRLNKDGASSDELRAFRRMVYKRVKENIEEDSIGAGQVCGILTDLKSSTEVIQEMVEGARTIISALEQIKANH